MMPVFEKGKDHAVRMRGPREYQTVSLQILTHDIVRLHLIPDREGVRSDLPEAVLLVKGACLFIFLPDAKPDLPFTARLRCLNCPCH